MSSSGSWFEGVVNASRHMHTKSSSNSKPITTAATRFAACALLHVAGVKLGCDTSSSTCCACVGPQGLAGPLHVADLDMEKAAQNP
jgi:hypothetical protein